MTTVVQADNSGSNALMVVLALAVIAAVAFGIYYFGGSTIVTPNNTTINVPAAPAPAPSAPSTTNTTINMPAAPAPEAGTSN